MLRILLGILRVDCWYCGLFDWDHRCRSCACLGTYKISQELCEHRKLTIIPSEFEALRSSSCSGLKQYFPRPATVYNRHHLTRNLSYDDHSIISAAVDQYIDFHNLSTSAFHCYGHSISNKYQYRDYDANIYYHLYSQSSTNSDGHSELVRISHHSHHNVSIDSEQRFKFQFQFHFQIDLPDPNN